MTSHAPIAPILIPFFAALLQLLFSQPAWQRLLGVLATVALVAATGWLTWLADDGVLRVYPLGDWPAPFGIVLVVDRLAAAMTLLSAILGFASLLYASSGFDQQAPHFHPLFQLQLFGLSGAFLTGDLFNLFVFFEVLLLASYVLLAHGGGRQRTRAGIVYVVLNLIGSALFLIGLGLLYGTLGTLNLADVAHRLLLDGHDPHLARLACALLIAVFALKAGLFPLSFWLPHTYAAAGVPVAALFAVLTKVGVVAILRLQTTALTAAIPDLLDKWLPALALATIALAACGVLAAVRLRVLAAWLVLLSAGTLLIAPAQASVRVDAAALYYLTQSTLAGAALFLLAGAIAEQRGDSADHLLTGYAPQTSWLKIAFFVVAVTLAGLPPFSGFIGKVMLLAALGSAPAAGLTWTVILAAGFVVMIALARAGSYLFWRSPPSASQPAVVAIDWQRSAAIWLLVAAGPLLACFAQPLSAFAERAANQLHDAATYRERVLAAQPPRPRIPAAD